MSRQPRLTVSHPHDPWEREADAIADAVMVGRRATPRRLATGGPDLLRCGATPPESCPCHGGPSVVGQVLRSPGRRLDTDLRVLMEHQLGADLSQVRIHADAHAAESARAVEARAYTVGNDVVFDTGGYSPRTPAGLRLLAHELVHVVQQREGPPAIQRQAREGASSWSQRELDVLSWGAGRFDDPQLQRAAQAVRTCRDFGKGCELLVTDDDLWSMYGEHQLIEDVFGEARADEALRTRQLRAVAAEAAAASAKPGAGAAAVVGAAPALAPGAPGQPAPIAPSRPPLRAIPGGRPPGVPPTPRTAPLPRPVPSGPGAAPSTAPRSVPRVGAGPAIVVVFGVVVALQLHAFGQFQRKAFAAGYVYVPSGRSVCMHGCHASPSRPQRRPPLTGLPLRDAPRIDPTSPEGMDDLIDWIARTTPQPRTGTRPQPTPAPRRRRRRRGCRIVPAPPSGGDPLSNLYCHQVTGTARSYRIYIETAAGAATRRWAEIDALRGNTWYECKCGYEALLTGASRGERVARAVLDKLDHQVLNHVHIARTCGLDYRYIVSNERVANILRARWHGNVTVEVRRFEPCD